ncbi:hypothetical protein [Rhodobacter calidifons]|uniref:Methyl-accepting chemotaxis protein n=1 Tax=Rhodobacter calidifons TaxID=2715277 RepID=A0ABX0G2R6_9RHOB|nr:hypothetical protein [Rhodobacter calidifons]NHB75490.1 hypothetical protein [Rhodobacter calidifons]
MEGLVISLFVLFAALWFIFEFIPKYIFPLLVSAIPFILIFAAAAAIFFYFRNEAKKRDEAEQDRIRRVDAAALERKRKEDEQKRISQQIESRINSANELVRRCVEHARSAEDHLAQSLVDFEERALYPFWDQIAACANEIAGIKKCLDLIRTHSENYQELRLRFNQPAPNFPVSIETVRAICETAGTVTRLKSITRAAHKDKDFAGIFAVHKTNQILVAGFSSLASALDDVSSQIRNQTDCLVSSLDAIRSEVRDAGQLVASRIDGASAEVAGLWATSQNINKSIEANSEWLSVINSQNRLYDEQMVKMLDNIQRNKKPLPEWISN